MVEFGLVGRRRYLGDDHFAVVQRCSVDLDEDVMLAELRELEVLHEFETRGAVLAVEDPGGSLRYRSHSWL